MTPTDRKSVGANLFVYCGSNLQHSSNLIRDFSAKNIALWLSLFILFAVTRNESSPALRSYSKARAGSEDNDRSCFRCAQA